MCLFTLRLRAARLLRQRQRRNLERKRPLQRLSRLKKPPQRRKRRPLSRLPNLPNRRGETQNIDRVRIKRTRSFFDIFSFFTVRNFVLSSLSKHPCACII